jgi:tetratricopeptide (TPR) repeat protein
VGDPSAVTRLKCPSWEQLEAIYERDIRRGALALKSPNPPPIGSRVNVELILPSGTALPLTGLVTMHRRDTAGASMRIEIQLQFAPGDLWMIESGIAAARRARQAPPEAPASEPVSGDIEVEIEDMPEDVETATAENELAVALQREFDTLKGKPPHQILGIAKNAAPEAAREAFTQLSKRYHPDAYARFTNERLWSLAGELFIMVSDAFTAVAEQAATRASSMLGGLETGVADMLLDDQRYEDAMEQFEALLKTDPKNRRAKLGLEVARGLKWLRDGGNPGAAAQHFQRILEADPANERAQAVMGKLMRWLTADSRERLNRLMKGGK